MSNFKTYRVRYCEWQTFAINLSARNADEACALAEQIRSEIGQEPFEELDGASDGFEAREISSVDLPPERRRNSAKEGGAP
jgi:hypothetical protein